MKTNPVHINVLLLCAIALLSCRKEKTATTNTELLTQRSWHYQSFGIDQNLDGHIDIPNNFQNCAKDDIIRFAADGTGTLDQNFDFCDPDFPKISDFTWQFLENETQLEYGGTVHTILTLNESQLSIYTEEGQDDNLVRYVLIYRH